MFRSVLITNGVEDTPLLSSDSVAAPGPSLDEAVTRFTGHVKQA